MTFRDLNLVAGLAAMATLGFVGCAESPEPGFTPSAAPSGFTAPADPAMETTTPAPALPQAPPEIPADGIRSPSEPIDPDERPPGAPPSPVEEPPHL